MDAQHRTARGFDRLVNFSDAIVAIAITLLVLPSMDLQTDSSEGTWDLLTGDKTASVFWSFFVTFFVTAIMWLAHHRVFEYVDDYDQPLIWLNFMWLLMIVLLPFMSGELNKGADAAGTVTAYCLVMAGLSALLGLIVLWVQKHPELMASHAKPDEISGVRSWFFCIYLSVLAVFALWFPEAATYGLAGLFVIGRLSHIVGDRRINHPDRRATEAVDTSQ